MFNFVMWIVISNLIARYITYGGDYETMFCEFVEKYNKGTLSKFTWFKKFDNEIIMKEIDDFISINDKKYIYLLLANLKSIAEDDVSPSLCFGSLSVCILSLLNIAFDNFSVLFFLIVCVILGFITYIVLNTDRSKRICRFALYYLEKEYFEKK